MALQSMTGFARADGAHGSYRWHWELRSVNGKSLDCRFRLPSGFETLEPTLRASLAEHIRRGNCQASLQLEKAEKGTAVRVNEAVLSDVIAAARAVAHAAEEQGVSVAPASADGLLAIRGVLETVDVEESADEQAALEAAIAASFADAAKALAAARGDEGRKLTTIVGEQIDRIEGLTAEAAASPASGVEALRARLKTQVAELLEASPALPEDRLAQEAAVLATKADVREEIDRLGAHVTQARELMQAGEPVGRRLDFLTQEFNREANTLCSKAADAGLTRIGLDLKAVIDQLKEQVQNVE
ncbi:MAG: YicC/YloC family endoribonuclease [Parvibaculaceae bacterium]